MDRVVLKPNAGDIKEAGRQFDAENEVLEEALQELFRQYPNNADIPPVLLKVTALNTLYSTQIPLYNSRIPTIFDVAAHIVDLGIDSDLLAGSPELVNRIAKTAASGKAGRYYYSFATKYCSWHDPNSYPIFDSRVLAYLGHLRKSGCLRDFHQNDLWDYPQFKKIVIQFRDENDLRDFNFKQIDKFMYLQGAVLVGRKDEPVEEEPILVPALDQPNEEVER
jgi:hypothetical protein